MPRPRRLSTEVPDPHDASVDISSLWSTEVSCLGDPRAWTAGEVVPPTPILSPPAMAAHLVTQVFPAVSISAILDQAQKEPRVPTNFTIEPSFT